MNKVILIGRLTKDPEVRYSQGDTVSCIARYTLAIDRKGKEGATDFIPCVAFNKTGEFVEKYLQKGMKIVVVGRIQTGSYTNRDGQKIYTTDVVVEEHEFVESKGQSTAAGSKGQRASTSDDGFMAIPDDVEDEGLPFN